MAREKQVSPAGEKRLEQYGVWVKVEPREVTEPPERENAFELSDLEAPKGGPRESTLTEEEEELLDELETELVPGEEEASIPEEEPLPDEAEELPEISLAPGEGGEFEAAEAMEEEQSPRMGAEKGATGGEEPETGVVEVTLSDSLPAEEHFDDLSALEEELASVPAAASESKAGSAEILSRIEEELRSIRTDLAELKKQLEGLRKTGAEPSEEEPKTEAEAKAGFFDEDEDETIALTGDELDNILNTAEITEEPAEVSAKSPEDRTTEAPADPDAATVQGDIIGYGDILRDEDLNEPPEEQQDTAEPVTTLEEQPAETLAELTDEALQEMPTEILEELPAELVLEEPTVGAVIAQAAPSATLEAMPELDLEALPEIEEEGEIAEEPAELEAISVEEEPPAIEPTEEPLDELEAILEEEPAGNQTALESADEVAADVDLEALAAHAEELEGEMPSEVDTGDLEIGELEVVPEDEETPESPQKEIEIVFESEQEPAEAPVEESAEEVLEMEEVSAEEPVPAKRPAQVNASGIPEELKDELRTVLKYMDHLLEALPDEKIQEFASSEYFTMYKKLFEDLGLGE